MATNNRINFDARHVLLYYMEMRQGGASARPERACWLLAGRVDSFIATGGFLSIPTVPILLANIRRTLTLTFLRTRRLIKHWVKRFSFFFFFSNYGKYLQRANFFPLVIPASSSVWHRKFWVSYSGKFARCVRIHIKKFLSMDNVNVFSQSLSILRLPHTK